MGIVNHSKSYRLHYDFTSSIIVTNMEILEKIAGSNNLLNGSRPYDRPKLGTIAFLDEHQGTPLAVIRAHTILMGISSARMQDKYKKASDWIDNYVDDADTIPTFMLTEIEPSLVEKINVLCDIDDMVEAATSLMLARKLGEYANKLVLSQIGYID
jgi:hypothetical protein